MGKEKYSYEQKLEAVLNVTEKHMSYRTVAKLIGAGETPVYRWVKRYEQFGVEGLLLRKGTYDGQFKVYVVNTCTQIIFLLTKRQFCLHCSPPSRCSYSA